jgi:hypothetical protein
MSAEGPAPGDGDQPGPAGRGQDEPARAGGGQGRPGSEGGGQDRAGSAGGGQGRLGEMDDDQLLAALGEVLRSSQAPPSWSVELAKASYGLLAADAELARLTSDSGLATAPSGLRSAAAPRLTVFDAGDLSVEVQIEAGARAGSWRLIGQLNPAAAARIQVRQAQPESFWVDVDDLGRFVVDELRDGPLSLLCARPGRQDAVTEWITIG